MSETIRIAQLSDTHFLEPGAEPEGGHAYETGAAFDAVFEHLGAGSEMDLVVITGDVADHGRPQQYRLAAEAFSRFAAPVNVCPGNHDLADAFDANMARPSVGTSRVVEIGAWAFLFVDSCAGLMVADETGRHVDPPAEQRLHSNGSLGAREAAWVRRMCHETTAANVFVWLHHPPGVPVPLVSDDQYTAEWAALLAELPLIRGFGGGHTHIPADYAVAGRPVWVAPSLKNNFSLDPQTWLPPGYRTYRFEPDGTVRSDLHLVDDERWPRRPFGRLLKSLFMGEITHADLAEIVARRATTS
ncbi:MAG: metallophosphoesterase [Actinomycetota bacterium]